MRPTGKLASFRVCVRACVRAMEALCAECVSPTAGLRQLKICSGTRFLMLGFAAVPGFAEVPGFAAVSGFATERFSNRWAGGSQY